MIVVVVCGGGCSGGCCGGGCSVADLSGSGFFFFFKVALVGVGLCRWGLIRVVTAVVIGGCCCGSDRRAVVDDGDEREEIIYYFNGSKYCKIVGNEWNIVKFSVKIEKVCFYMSK